MAVFRSGLDWSGDAGDPAKVGSQPYLVFAIAHIAERDIDHLHALLQQVRHARGLPDNYAFKYKKSRPDIRQALFARLHDAPIDAHVVVVEKQRWSPSYLRSTRGADRVNDGIVELIRRCHQQFVDGQVLLIDGERDELPVLRATRRALSQAMMENGNSSFKKVRLCADTDEAGSIIQIADMIAGVVRDQGTTGSLQGELAARIRRV